MHDGSSCRLPVQTVQRGLVIAPKSSFFQSPSLYISLLKEQQHNNNNNNNNNTNIEYLFAPFQSACIQNTSTLDQNKSTRACFHEQESNWFSPVIHCPFNNGSHIKAKHRSSNGRYGFDSLLISHTMLRWKSTAENEADWTEKQNLPR